MTCFIEEMSSLAIRKGFCVILDWLLKLLWKVKAGGERESLAALGRAELVLVARVLANRR